MVRAKGQVTLRRNGAPMRIWLYPPKSTHRTESSIEPALASAAADLVILGRITNVPAALEVGRLTANRSRESLANVFVDDLTKAWRGTLDW